MMAELPLAIQRDTGKRYDSFGYVTQILHRVSSMIQFDFHQATREARTLKVLNR